MQCAKRAGHLTPQPDPSTCAVLCQAIHFGRAGQSAWCGRGAQQDGDAAFKDGVDVMFLRHRFHVLCVSHQAPPHFPCCCGLAELGAPIAPCEALQIVGRFRGRVEGSKNNEDPLAPHSGNYSLDVWFRPVQQLADLLDQFPQLSQA